MHDRLPGQYFALILKITEKMFKNRGLRHLKINFKVAEENFAIKTFYRKLWVPMVNLLLKYNTTNIGIDGIGLVVDDMLCRQPGSQIAEEYHNILQSCAQLRLLWVDLHNEQTESRDINIVHSFAFRDKSVNTLLLLVISVRAIEECVVPLINDVRAQALKRLRVRYQDKLADYSLKKFMGDIGDEQLLNLELLTISNLYLPGINYINQELFCRLKLILKKAPKLRKIKLCAREMLVVPPDQCQFVELLEFGWKHANRVNSENGTAKATSVSIALQLNRSRILS
jgi:hypothetical protein